MKINLLENKLQKLQKSLIKLAHRCGEIARKVNEAKNKDLFDKESMKLALLSSRLFKHANELSKLQERIAKKLREV